MGDKSGIEWTEATWNPVRGCTKISPGCAHCYAETFAERWRGVPGHPYERGFDLRLVPEKLDDPLRWRRPRKIFVNSMSDLYHKDVPDEYVARVFDVMRRAPQHTFQVLTKRAERQRDLLLSSPLLAWFREQPLPNVWLGVSAEDQTRWSERVPKLHQTPAAVRFVSVEPLIGPIDPSGYVVPAASLGSIGWVIVGGESGAAARSMDVSWARRLLQECERSGIAAFMKQLGAAPVDGDELVPITGKGKRMEEWPADLRVREYP